MMATPVQQLVRRVLSPNFVPRRLFTSPKSPGKGRNFLETSKSPRVRNNIFKPSSSGQYVSQAAFSASPKDSTTPDRKLAARSPFLDVKHFGFSENLYLSDGDSSAKRKSYSTSCTPQSALTLKKLLNNQCSTVLGRGQFGTVYRTSYKGNVVAVKLLNYKNSTFQHELNVLKLNHENIIEIIRIIREPTKNLGIIIMKDYSKAKDLHSLLHDTNIKIPKNTIVKWAIDIVRGLQHCHDNNILHLDVKPKNILVGSDEICRVCDFGSSMDISSQDAEIGIVMPSCVGTVVYAAPEIFRGESVSFPTDVYSLGITLWQMESRKVPYEHLDCPHAVIYEVVKRDLRPQLPKTLSNLAPIYEVCWLTNPLHRPHLNSVINHLHRLYLND